ncbi:Patatin [Paraglaciecola sp. T6c]|uniref:patatin-like phospholipase family protein n=1 Tax=Pseudoalteromonas atlantica (strain T6c / ATCC BAA-1087) TaxID=3042615 RepID=UPI00005C65A5|nr:patatin family protein [Paraglaciecola sp. T6c]ABG41128.1 Patatin [Paraglaciecola sp. T6c]
MKSLASTNAINLNKSAQPKLALIAEGGGQRGIFTAGVLDAWLEEGYDPFDMFFGTSAGSQNLTSYLARQKGYAKRLIRGLSRHKRFFHLGRGLVGKHIVDLDWYFDKTTEANRAIDFTTAKRSLGDRELYITATNARDRNPYFLSPTGESQQWRELLKASSALPFLYKRGVKLTPWLGATAANESDVTAAKEPGAVEAQADFYLDGGLAAPLPVIEAYNRGARKIVVIRTADAQFQAQSAWVHKLRTLVCASGYCPKTIDYLVQHEQAYQQELAFIANPPADVEIVQIFAGERLHSKLLGSTDTDLKHDHKIGVAAGKAFLQGQYAFESAELERAQPESAELNRVDQAALYDKLGNVAFEARHQERSPEKSELRNKALEARVIEEVADKDAEYDALTLDAFVASQQATMPQRLSA